jgi:hypothetical protein
MLQLPSSAPVFTPSTPGARPRSPLRVRRVLPATRMERSRTTRRKRGSSIENRASRALSRAVERCRERRERPSAGDPVSPA